MVYNIAGQLLTQQQIYSGSNIIDPCISGQIIIAKVIMGNKVYQKKLMIH